MANCARGVDIARQRVGAGQLGAGCGIVGLDREHALEGDDRLAEATGIDRRDAKRIVEGRIASAHSSLGRKRAVIGLGLVAQSLCSGFGSGAVGLAGALGKRGSGREARRQKRGRPEHGCPEAECGNPCHDTPAPKFFLIGAKQWRRRAAHPTDKQCQGDDKYR